MGISNIVKKQTDKTHRILFYLFNKNLLSDYYVPYTTLSLRTETSVEVRNYRPIQYSFRFKKAWNKYSNTGNVIFVLYGLRKVTLSF